MWRWIWLLGALWLLCGNPAIFSSDGGLRAGLSPRIGPALLPQQSQPFIAVVKAGDPTGPPLNKTFNGASATSYRFFNSSRQVAFTAGFTDGSGGGLFRSDFVSGAFRHTPILLFGDFVPALGGTDRKSVV